MPPPPGAPLLCLAGTSTTAVVTAVANEFGFRVVEAHTLAEAAAHLAGGCFSAIVAALGKQPGTDTIIDGSGRIALFDGFPGTKIIFSHTAASNPRIAQICKTAGANAVVARRSDLRKSLPPPPTQPPLPLPTLVQVARSALGGGPLRVPATPPLERFHYMAPGATSLSEGLARADSAPPLPAGCVRIVCISDTHNEHESLRLPDGDVLVHAGDCLTESGRRHVERRADGSIVRVLPEGEALFARFAAWLGAQAHGAKVFIGGNHDLVLQGLGPARVRQILEERASCGPPPVYLEHSAATLPCGLTVFGSPFACWGGKNDAFFAKDGANFGAVPRCDVVVTHMPCVLPRGGGRYDEDAALGHALARSGASLHVSGHCHWAHGLYRSREGGGVPCVVASVCDAHWHGPHELKAASGARGDAKDARRGGYNVELAPIVCDLRLPVPTACP